MSHGPEGDATPTARPDLRLVPVATAGWVGAWLGTSGTPVGWWVLIGSAVAAGVLAARRRSAWLTAVLVVLVGVLDGLDGAVALRTGRARPLGAVVDAVADRLGDVLLAVALAALGAPPPWCVAAVGLTVLHEYLRARANAAGMPGPGAVTVAERPTRLVLVGIAALGAGVRPGGTPWTGWDWATVSAVAWVAVGAVGLVHLTVGVVRTTPRTFGP